MSRNLCRTDCEACPAPRVFLVESPRPITKEDAGVYFDTEYRGMLVADAECALCCAKYLAWVDDRGAAYKSRYGGSPRFDSERDYFDLSYRSTFNDEPGLADLPIYRVEVAYVRVGTIRRCRHGTDIDAVYEWRTEQGCDQCRWEERLHGARDRRLFSVFWTPKVGSPSCCMDSSNFYESPTDPHAKEMLARWMKSASERGTYVLRQWRADDVVSR